VSFLGAAGSPAQRPRLQVAIAAARSKERNNVAMVFSDSWWSVRLTLLINNLDQVDAASDSASTSTISVTSGNPSATMRHGTGFVDHSPS
jgi:hypothetical protein